MERGQVFVRARRRDGTYGAIDALDLDDASFRAFVVDMLHRAIKDEYAAGEHIEYREREAPPADPIIVKVQRQLYPVPDASVLITGDGVCELRPMTPDLLAWFDGPADVKFYAEADVRAGVVHLRQKISKEASDDE